MIFVAVLNGDPSPFLGECRVGTCKLMSFHTFVSIIGFFSLYIYIYIFPRFCSLGALVGHCELTSFHPFVYHRFLQFICIFSTFCSLGSLVGHCELVSFQPDIFWYVSVKTLIYLFFFMVLLSSDWNLEWGGGPPILKYSWTPHSKMLGGLFGN